jgi:hypothetical protein
MQIFLRDTISTAGQSLPGSSNSPAVARLAEDCRNIATELCKVLQKARNVLDIDSSGDSAQIQCLQWKAASLKFRKGATSLLEHYHTLSVLLKVIRKIMKEVFKSSKRHFRRAAFELGYAESPLLQSVASPLVTDRIDTRP